ncbi:MAG: FAD-dependent oxidoreductase [Thermoleophilia bacterium]|nr:FAD-dependent oxidoreductase [Thermoleophilia bacterium]
MRHTRYGWWLEDAGPVEPTRPLEGEARADVAIVGGGYLGLWTAWQLKRLAPSCDVVVLEAGLAGHGPSGRNGGFVSTLWDDLPILRDRVGDARAVEVCRASERGVHGIGAFCAEEGVDAWFREAPTIYAATSPDHYHHFADSIEECRAVGAPEEMVALSAAEVQARVAAPLLRDGVLVRLSATVHPARLSLGLRARVLAAGVRLHERTRVTSFSDDGVETERGRVRAGAVVVAVNSATGRFPGYRLAHAVASSHMVMTEPVPDVIEELGWTGGECLADGRTLVHYTRTTRDGRIAFGWGGGRMGVGAYPLGRLEVDRTVIRAVAEHAVQFFPGLRGRRLVHAWGGPIDVSPTHLPIFGSRGRVHHGFGFTGNGVGPSYLGGEILARLALDRRDELTALALVDPAPKLFPPEPLRWLGGSLIREALVRRDAAQAAGRPVPAATEFVASLPRRLGLRLPR